VILQEIRPDSKLILRTHVHQKYQRLAIHGLRVQKASGAIEEIHTSLRDFLSLCLATKADMDSN
jgi:hypothetical protein